MRSILLAAKPLMDEHNDTILRHRTQKDVVCWEAERAARAWLVPLAKVVRGLRDRDVLGRLRLSCGTAANLECPDALEALEAPVARRHLRLVLALLSSRSWSQCVHSETFPGLLAVAFHPEVATAKIGMLKAARLRRALGEALDLARQEPEENQALVACLRDVAYHEHVLVQDLWSLADQAAWDRKDRRLRELLWVVFSGPGNTKVHLEDVFNATRDECRRNPNKRVSRRGRARARTGRSAGARLVASLGLLLPPARRRPACRWRAYHAARHTTSLENQLPSLKLTLEDWAAAPVVSPARVEEGMFVPGNHKPQIDLAALGGGQAPTARAAGGAWRASGHAANCRSVAASAFLAATAADGFQSAGAAWQGAAPP